MHQVDADGKSPGVHRELTKGIGSLLGWRKGVRQKKIETHRKTVGGSREAYRERLNCPGYMQPWLRALLAALSLAKGYLAKRSKLLAMAKISHVVKSHDRMGNLGG
ncbi:hypothetical protein B296_00038282 [Ensete ventricosum]|uniref:Uncharacterized protein n=1 Tax=Ensete ventricosum TaxID=4639 RepID=A0A426Y1A0_ENSVE|nr:hypothetical protein B296_00038282 [Ensete ventricosum]